MANGNMNKVFIWLATPILTLFFASLLTMSMTALAKSNSAQSVSAQNCHDVAELKASDHAQDAIDRRRSVEVNSIVKDIESVKGDIGEIKTSQQSIEGAVSRIEMSQMKLQQMIFRLHDVPVIEDQP